MIPHSMDVAIIDIGLPRQHCYPSICVGNRTSDTIKDPASRIGYWVGKVTAEMPCMGPDGAIL